MRKLVSAPASPISSHAPVPQEPQAIKTYLVRTVFGAAVLFASSWVYVKVGDEYIRKPVSELSKGEEVLFAKEGLRGLSVEQMNEALLKSDRYAATFPVLFRETNGVRLPAFTHALLDGIGSLSAWSEVRGANLSRGSNGLITLDDDQAAGAAQFIQDRLGEAEVSSVQTNHIRHGWLGGHVIAPRNRVPICTVLLPFAPSLSSVLSDAFGDAYRLYVAIRRSAISVLSTELRVNLSPRPSSPETKPPGDGISVRPELAILLAHFASNVSATHGAGRVLEITPLQKHETPHDEREEGIFFRGIVTGKIEDSALKIKSPIRVMLETSVLVPIITRIVYEFMIHEITSTITMDSGGFGERQINIPDLMDGLNQSMGFGRNSESSYAKAIKRLRAAGAERLDEFLPQVETKTNSADPAEKKALCDRFVQALSSGELDRLYKLDVGTLSSVCDTYYKLISAIPEDIYYLQEIQSIILAKRKKAQETGQAVTTKTEEREFAKVQGRLTRLCSVDVSAESVVSTAIYLSTHPGMPGIGLDTIHNVLMGNMSPAEALAGIRSTAQTLIPPTVDDDRALILLSSMGFSSGVQGLYPRANFRIIRPTYATTG